MNPAKEVLICPKHPNVQPFFTCPACLGEKGGAVSSPAKTAAAKRNRAKGGGWPKGKKRKPAA